jgi:hypothetical protein
MVAMCPGKRAALDKNDALDRIVKEIEYGVSAAKESRRRFARDGRVSPRRPIDRLPIGAQTRRSRPGMLA